MAHPQPPDFEELRRTHSDRIYRFCRRLCDSVEDAEDLAQDVFLLAFQGLSRFEGRSSPLTWLYRITLHRWQRMNRTRPLTTDPLHEEAIYVAVSDPAAISYARLSLEEAMATLSPAQREALLLVKAEGLTYAEAAQVLGIPRGTVQFRVHEASARLRRHLSPSEETPTEIPKNASHRKEGIDAL